MPIGARAYLGLAKETTWGTPVAPSVYIPFVSESVTDTIEELVGEGIRNLFDEPPSYQGLKSVAGDIEVEVLPEFIGHFLNAAFGSVSSTQPDPTGAPSVYRHTFTPTQTAASTECDLPSYTLEIDRDFESAFQIAGAAATSFEFTIGTGAKIAHATISFIAKSISTKTKTSPSYEATNPFLWDQLTATLGGAAFGKLSDITISLDNALEGVPLLNGSDEIARIRRNDFRTVTISGTIIPDNLDEWTAFRNGTETELIIDLLGEAIEGGYSYELKFTMPKFRWLAVPINVGGPGYVSIGFSGKAKYDVTNGFAIQAELTNTTTGY
ncbi:TPA: hypothetical protein EYP37_04430 [Candidatus Poribacteria bacterium]|nr:hypothetical protein [Candidatus Poribacteria bacterium]